MSAASSARTTRLEKRRSAARAGCGHVVVPADVGARAEAAAGASEDYHADIVVGVGLGHGPAVLVLHSTGPRVHPFGPAQRDDGDAVLDCVLRDLQVRSFIHLSTKGMSSGRRSIAASGSTS